MTQITSDLKFQSIFDKFEQVIYISDPKTYEILYVNEITQKLFPGEVIGTKCYKTFQNLDEPCPFCTNPILFGKTPQSPYIWEFHNPKIDRWFHITDQVIDWEGRKVRFEMAEDITKAKNIEMGLRQSKEQLDTIFSNLKDTVFVISKDYEILFKNEQAHENFGVDLIGEVCYNVIKGRDSPCEKCPINTFSSKEICKVRFDQDFLVPKTGLIQYFDIVATPIKDYKGNSAIVELLRDNTEKIKAQQKLEQLSNELEVIIDSFPGLVFYKDLENNYIRVNKYVADAHNLPKEKMEGVTCFDLYPKEQAQAYWDDDLEVIKSKKPKLNFVEPWETDVGTRWVSTNKIPYINEMDEVEGIIGISRDITEKYILEQEIKEQKEWFETTLKSIGDAVITTDVDAYITFMNNTAEKLTGWMGNDALGKPIHEVFKIQNQFTHERVENPVDLVIQKGIIVGLANHTILIAKDGTKRNISDSGAPIKDEKGKIIGVILVFQDVTEEYQLRARIEASEKKHKKLAFELETIMDSIPGLIFYKDAENNFVKVNKYIADAHQLPKEKLEGKNLSEIYPKEQAQAYWEDDLNVIKSGVPKLNYEEPWDTEEGLKWVSTSKIPFIDVDDKITGIIGVSMDITERKLSEQKVIHQNKILNSINEIFQNALSVDTEEELADVCLSIAEKSVGAKFGFFGEINMKGKFDTLAISNPGWGECNIPKDQARLVIKDMEIRGMQFLPLKDGIARIINEPKNHPESVGTPEGHPEIKNLLAVPFKYKGEIIGQIGLGNKVGGFSEEDKEIIQTISFAIVEALMKKRAENELIKHKEHLELLIDERTSELKSALENLKQINQDLHIKNIVFNSSLSAQSTADVNGIINGVNPAFIKLWGYESEADAIGNSVGSFFVNPEDANPVLEALTATGKWEGEFLAKRKNGEQFISQGFATAIYNEQGEHIGFQSANVDVTEHIESQRKLEYTLEELKRSNTELGQFAYVASHDLQEPLRMVASFTQLLQKRYADKLDKDANEFIDFAVDGATRMQSLISDLLIFSRVGTRGKPFKETDMNIVIRSVLANLNQAIKENNAEITMDPLPVIIADDSQMVQLFQNLIGNAIKFHDEEKSPVIHISGEVREYEWLFSVKDNGIGIETQFFDRIFIIFQRLHKKDEYGGTGIGLAVCKKIIQRHGGKIWLESETGKGSTFFFSIPRQNNKNN